MNGNPVYVLIHSPLVGGLTWTLVADEMRQRGLNVIVPVLNDSPGSKESFWKQHVDSFAQTVKHLPKNETVTLVAHSGAGPLLPAIRAVIPNPINAYVFVDAGLPKDGATRLGLMLEENSEWAGQLQAELERGGQFPTWSSEDLREIIPDENLRKQLIAEINPRKLDFFTEPIPVFHQWPDAPCIYILFSPPYITAEIQARQSGWKTYKLDAGHFHMLVDAKSVADIIIRSINEIAP
jgi:pimeloyl-ACP methyl ester carboxylesterase